jgi:hypothetical protein
MKPTFRKILKISRIAKNSELFARIDKIDSSVTTISRQIETNTKQIDGNNLVLNQIHLVVKRDKPLDFENVLANVFAHLPGFNEVKDEQSFLEVVATEKARHELEKKSGINKDTILRFANIIDLKRIDGVDEKTAILLEAAGVDSPFELKDRVPEKLHETIKNTITEKGIKIELPTIEQITLWKNSPATAGKIIYHGSERPPGTATEKIMKTHK